MPHILVIDAGTTSVRAVVYDSGLKVKSSAQKEFRQFYPSPGFVEHDAGEIYAAVLEVVRQAVSSAGREKIAGIGITNQRETTVLFNRDGNPVHRAVVWQCRRSADICRALKDRGLEKTFSEKTGLVLDAYFSGTKVKWLLDNVAGARTRAERGELAFGTIDTWLVWQLTGGRVHCTDPSNASRTLLFDIHTGAWDDELLALLDVPRSLLPQVVPSSGVCGHAPIDGVDIPIAGIAGDQQAALFGQACLKPGMA